MARKISGGLVGQPSVGAINVAPTAVMTAALDQNITISPVGNAVIVMTNNVQLDAQNDLRFADADSSNWVAFQAPATVTSNVTWTLPATDGSNNQVLTTNGAGTLSWTAKDVAIVDQILSSTTHYITMTTATSGIVSTINTSSTNLSFQPSTGTFTATAIVESSSIVLKENINPIENALNSILQLSGVTYDRTDTHVHEAGLIAEWVNEILPDLVTKDATGSIVGIKYTKLSAYLIEAIKTLKLEIDRLKGV
jgi:hypothetical protein